MNSSPVRHRRSSLFALLPAATAVAAVALLFVAAASPARAAAPAGEVHLRRFALMAGLNDGGPTRPQLRYAASDAQAMTRVLESLGGLAPDDVVLVSDATRAAFLGGFDRLERLVAASRAPGVRREIFVYYSGHSDEDGLLIGADRVSYDELRARIQAMPGEVRLAILDSCASGGFTRRKGGVRRPPFMLDASANTKGHAFLTSSAVNEVAQESDRIGASFFTHFLVSGLRGAADVDRDRRVTLQEAFQFAAQETLARTEKTRGGPQHAAYEFDLVGTSDLVVTDVRTTQATLSLAPDLAGRISVRDAGGGLIVELRKASGRPIDLGLEAGPYVVTMDGASAVFEAQVTLAMGQRAELSRLAFHPGRPLEVAVARGDGPAVAATAAAPPPPEATASATATPAPVALPPGVPLRSTRLHLGMVPQAGDAEVDVHGLSFSLIADRVGRLSSGLQLSLGANVADQAVAGTQLSIGGNVIRGGGGHAQLAVGLNFAGGPFSGAQAASGANVAMGEFHGAQLGAGANFTSGEMRGAQLSAGVNFARAGGRGAQLGAGVNVALADWRGLQSAGGVNVAESISGAQIAPVNLASDATGLQLGVVNVARGADGAQVGVVNVAGHGRGFKLGVINIARRHDGDTLGIINIIGDGIHDVAVYATDTMLSNVALQLGSRHLYTSFVLAYQPGEDLGAGAGPARFQRSSRRYGYGMSFGYRRAIGFGRLDFLQVEVNAMSIGTNIDAIQDNAPILASTRAVVGIRLFPGLSAIAGISENVAIGQNGQDLDIGSGFLESHDTYGQVTLRRYPGLLLGLQI